MKYRVIGWTSYENQQIPEGEYSLAKDNAIIKDLREHGYVFTGMHHESHPYCAPVLNTGEKILLSQRGFGDTMSKARQDGTYVDYAYDWDMDFDDKGCVFPEKERCIDFACEKESELSESYEANVTREQLELAKKTGGIIIYPDPVYDFLDAGDYLTLCCGEERQAFLVTEHCVDIERETKKLLYKLKLEIVE